MRTTTFACLGWLGALAAGCGSDSGGAVGDTLTGDASDATDAADASVDVQCPSQPPTVTGIQLWVSRPDGTCAVSPSRQEATPTYSGTFSPDGQRVRYYHDAAYVVADLYGDTRAPTPSGYISPDWTWVVDYSGDNPIDIVMARVDGTGAPAHREVSFDQVQGIAWAPDSAKFQANLEDISTESNDGPEVFGTDLGVVANFVGQFYEGGWTWSPDSTLLADRWPTVEDESGVFVLALDGSEPTKVADAGVSIAWLPSSRELLIGGGSSGAPSLLRVAADGSSKTSLWEGSDPVDVLAVSPDGRTAALAVGPSVFEAHLVLFDLATRAQRAVAGPKRPSGAFSADGARFGFTADDPDSGRSQAFTVRADGTELVRLSGSTTDPSGFLQWSPDPDLLLWFGPGD